ncbi:hypothetical protein COR50_00725 [Chitinophaga caeni]|uniref:Uncharacterized protein n=1 Tax=Chitinophaga caeni TaxID=2029983 RepID=A0A291QP71_9BACT|nr:hypothetical protein [Chitinophaga caeni]ATL45799.1 hypothetical protein COR50_00725 [Chitinophaga caeni]
MTVNKYDYKKSQNRNTQELDYGYFLPTSKKKLKRKIQPPYRLLNQMKAFRVELDNFPYTWEQFLVRSSDNRQTAQQMNELGFHDLYVSYSQRDSMVVDFQFELKRGDKESNQLSKFYPGRIIFTYSDSMFYSHTQFWRPFQKKGS